MSGVSFCPRNNRNDRNRNRITAREDARQYNDQRTNSWRICVSQLPAWTSMGLGTNPKLWKPMKYFPKFAWFATCGIFSRFVFFFSDEMEIICFFLLFFFIVELPWPPPEELTVSPFRRLTLITVDGRETDPEFQHFIMFRPKPRSVSSII